MAYRCGRIGGISAREAAQGTHGDWPFLPSTLAISRSMDLEPMQVNDIADCACMSRNTSKQRFTHSAWPRKRIRAWISMKTKCCAPAHGGRLAPVPCYRPAEAREARLMWNLFRANLFGPIGFFGQGRREDGPPAVRGNEVLEPAAQKCDQRSWFVTSWWNCTSEALMRVPRALGQRSAWACLISANLACTSSPITSCMNRLPLNSRMAS